MKSDFLIAVTQLAAERNLSRETVISAIEAALISAYKKESQAAGQNIKVKLDPGSGKVWIYVMKSVAEEVEDSEIEISLSEAKKIVPDAEVGADIAVKTIVQSAGRIAAQTAKQVVLQRLREAERDLIYEEFSGKEGEVLSATVQRVEPRQIMVDVGRAEAILPPPEQVFSERYRPGQKIKVVLLEVRHTTRGPEIIVSRSHKDLIKRLFEMEVPEIYSGAIEIMAIAREPGSRSKVAVRARRDGVDPVGSCVGLRGIRIQNIVNELQGEKIDVVEWQKDQAAYLANSLSPSQVTRVHLNAEDGAASIVVPDRHLSLAIGREGQNARLAAKLTGWKVDIRSASEAEEDRVLKPAPVEAKEVAPVSIEEKVAVADEAKREEPEVVEEQLVEEPAAEAPSEPEPVEEERVEEEGVPEEEVGSSPAEELAVWSLAETEEPVKEEVPVSPMGRALSLDEVPEDVWSIQTSRAQEPGKIRFAEDIAGTRANRRAKNIDRPDRGGQKSRRGKKVRVARDGDRSR